MATLKDIATSLNLSIPVVSKVLNDNMGTTGCSAANKAAIRAKASELNYRPNRIAQALRSGRTNSIGVCIHPLGAPGSDLVERLLMGLSFQANASHRVYGSAALLIQRVFLTFGPYSEISSDN